VTVTIPAILFLVAAVLAAAASFGVGTNIRTRFPNLGWLAVAALCLALFLQVIG
jgi:Flp pilus assembly pilin Flp